MNMAKESAQYAKRMQSKATLQKIKYDIKKVDVTSNVRYNGSSANGANITTHANHKGATFQGPSESALEEDEALIPARRARVSRVLLSWFIFEPAPREINVSETP